MRASDDVLRMPSDNYDIYLKSAALLSGIIWATALLADVLALWVHDPTLRWAAAFSMLQVFAVICMASYLLGQRAHAHFQRNIQEQIRPAIEQRIMGFAFTGEIWSTSVPKRGPARRVLEGCIAHALTGLKDSAKDRIAQFALDCGFVNQWVKDSTSSDPEKRKQAISRLGLVPQVADSKMAIHAALKDKQPTIRAEAARAVLSTAEPHDVDQVFRSALCDSLLVRVLLTSDLKRHARLLVANTIPLVLAENLTSDTKNCLELLNAWRLAIPALDSTLMLKQHRDPVALAIVLALLPYMTIGDSIEDDVLAELESDSLEVQCAAAGAVGYLKLERLIPALVRLLDHNVNLALAASFALARMGVQGVRKLELILSGPDRKAAAVAMEALENITVGTP